jgi:hypothetical protein
MLPGRIQRKYPMASFAPQRKCFMAHIRINVPVRPSPALQCTATIPGSDSTMLRKRFACATTTYQLVRGTCWGRVKCLSGPTWASGGGVPSGKKRS